MTDDDFTASILAHVASLPPHKRADEIHRIINAAVWR